jgi:YD repeat-containing protein
LRISERNGKSTTLTYSDHATPPAIAGKPGMLLQVTNHFNQAYRFTYDTAGRIASISDPTSRTTRYTYNAWGMLSEVEHPDGTQRRYHYGESPYWSTRAKYLTGITDEAGVRFATYNYDIRGRVTSTELAGGINKHTFAYFDEHTTARTFPNGPATFYKQERIGNRLRPAAITGRAPEGGGTQATQYDASGNIASTVDFRDSETRYAYDEKGRETQRIEDAGRPTQQTTTTEWHAVWNLPTRIAKANRIDTIEYDAKGQPVLHAWQTTSDANGERGFGAERVGRVSSIAWTYDANGLLTSLIEREGRRTVDKWAFTFDAQGNLATATDSRGRTSRALEYDGAGRLVDAIDLNGVRIRYVYDARARPVEYRHGENLTTYSYDAIGQLIRQTGPHGRVTEYEYDAAHRLIDVLDNGKSLLDESTDIDGGTEPTDERAPENVGANPFQRWFGWIVKWFDWLFTSAHAQITPAPSPHVLSAPTSMPGTWTPTPWDNMAWGTGGKRPWEWLAIWTQRVIDACTGKRKEEHRGRIQAQGPGYRDVGAGDVETWGPQPEPPTVSNGLGMLYALESRMKKKQLHDRHGALAKARRYVVSAGTSGGVGPPGQSFRNDEVIRRRGSERVDIEIHKGMAFVH